jgi:hypothetical protein
MRVERLIDVLTGLVVMLAILTYALASGNAMIALIGLPACVAAWLLGDQVRSMSLPRIAANALVLAAVARALLSAFERGVRVEDVCLLVVVILVIKLFDRKAARDYAQLLTLSVFLALGSVLTSNAFLMGLVLIGMLPAVIGAAIVFQLFTAWEQQSAIDEHAGRVTGSSPARDLVRLVVIGTAGAVAVAVCAFVLLPRGVGEDVLGRMNRPATGAQTGFTDSVDLGRGGLISESTAVVLDLAMYRTDTEEAIGESGLVYYLRGAVLDEYESGRWVRSREAQNYDSSSANALPDEKILLTSLPVDTPEESKIAQRVSIRKLGKGPQHVFALWQPEDISFDERTRFVRNSRDKTIEVEGRGGRLEYTVVSLVTDMRQPGSTERSPVPPVRIPGVRELGERLLRDRAIEPDPSLRPVEDDGRAARAIQDYLQSNCTYTLDVLAAPPGRDPVEWFLTEARTGHCEYFASAMALLCRSVGINTRVVTGYVAAEYNSGTGHYVVRESNAHAWVEVERLPGRWERFDPTPPADLDRIHRPALGLAGRFKQWFNALEYAWINSVVSYDQRTHRRISPSGLGADGSGGAVEGVFRNIQHGGMELWFRALLIGVMVFAACAAALTIVEMAGRTLAGLLASRRAHRAQIARDPELPRRMEQMGVYSDLLRAMSRAGHAKPRHRPPLAHVETLATLDAEAAVAAGRVVDLFYAIRYGRRVLTREQMAEARRSIGEFEHAMRRRR